MLIVHLSDIHIRTGTKDQCRYEEYTIVFDNLINNIKKIKEKFIIVITGDIFHNKNKIESCGILLFNKLIFQLSRLSKVYIIQGNHDYRQDLYDNPDLISAILYNNPNLKNVIYLNKTDIYSVNDNIEFGVVSVLDTLEQGNTSGQVKNLPDFPISNNNKFKIALFHGTINGCKLQNYSISSVGYPLEWFKNYNLILLGDIHLRQVYNINDNGNWIEDKQIWGYSGSLIQQNFGEPILDHGYLLWDIKNKKVSKINIYNPYAYVTMKENNNGIFVLRNKLWINIIWLLKHDLCPKTMYIKLTEYIFLENIENILKNYNIKYYIQSTNSSILNIPQNDNKFIIDTIIPLEILINYIKQKNLNLNINWEYWINNPENLCINKILDIPENIIKDRNDKIIKQCNIFHESFNKLNFNKKRIIFRYIEWHWILCFQNNCWINFDNFNNNIILINAPNGYGKTSFLEIICIALFGVPIISRYNKSNSSAIICQQKPNKVKSKTKIRINFNNNLYEIIREFDYKNNDKSKIINKDTYLYENGNILYSGKTTVDNWIEQNIGNIELFLLSGLFSQNNDQDFINLNNSQQIDILDNILGMNCIHLLYDIFKIASLAYKSIIENITILISSLNINFDENLYNQCKLNYEKISTNCTEICTEITEEYNNFINYVQEKYNSTSGGNLRTAIENLKDVNLISILVEKNKLINKELFDCNENEFEENYNNATEKYNKLINELKNINEQEKIVNKDLEFNKEIDFFEFNNNCTSCMNNFNKLNISDDKLEILQNKLNDINNIKKQILLDYNEFKPYYDEILYCKKNRNDWLTKVSICTKNLSLNTILNDNEQYKKYENLNNKIMKDYYIQQSIYDQKKINDNKIIYYNKELEKLIDIKNSIDLILLIFIDFKKWLYETKVIPKLCDETNKIIKIITQKNLELKVNIIDKFILQWLISDGINISSLEKTSGFEKFIIGMALRIVLSYIGISNTKWNTLFIDEGFTCCDSYHLQKVPDFIKNLLSLYDNIILVSHLEDLKQAANIFININRTSKNLSSIQYGASA